MNRIESIQEFLDRLDDFNFIRLSKDDFIKTDSVDVSVFYDMERLNEGWLILVNAFKRLKNKEHWMLEQLYKTKESAEFVKKFITRELIWYDWKLDIRDDNVEILLTRKA